MPILPLEQVTLAVLAGGAGARMGGPKAMLEVDGRPVLSFMLDRLAWPGPTMLVTAPGREHPPAWEQFGREVVDPAAGEGPLRGVMTALEHAPTDLLVIAAVDMPAVQRADLAWLVAELGPDALIAMASRGGTVEPLPCAMRSGIRPLVAGRLAAGRRSLHGLAADPGAVVVPADDRDGRAWLNANTPAEWAEMERQLRG